MADQSGTGESADRTAIAAYVATLSAELSVMARHGGLDTLSYLLDMVRLEAEDLARIKRPKANGGN